MGQRLFIRVIQVLIQDLGHGEHMNPLLFEHSAHCIVAADLASITRVLEFIFPDVLPDLFDCLRSRELCTALKIVLASDLNVRHTVSSPPRSADNGGERFKGF